MPENSILSPVSLTSFFDNATGEARQANLFFYKAGTLDPIVAYTDSGLMIPFPQPVATSGWGRVPPVYIGEIPAPGYRVRAFDQYQTLIEDLDGLPGALPTVTSSEPIDVDQTGIAKTGDIKMKWSNHNPELGWVEITKGGTIGNPASNASLMAHDDAHALFLHLWQQDALANADVTLQVVGGKGANAQGDWDLNKAIYVPDPRGRFIAGLDQADTATGTPPTASMTLRLDKGLFAALPNTSATKMVPWNLGAFGGESVHKLTPTELAVHLHDWIDRQGHTHVVHDPGHIHGVTDPGHTHGIETDAPSTNNVVGRMLSGGAYGLNSQVGGPFGQVGLTTLSHGAAISIQSGLTGIYLVNWNATSGQVGYGTQLQYIGAFSATPTTGSPPWPYGTGDNLWHNKTENYPKTNDGSDGTDMGDRPHNTLPPFILFAFYMKL
jgi:hypothetical protein